MIAAKAQISLRKCAVSLKPLLLVHTELDVGKLSGHALDRYTVALHVCLAIWCLTGIRKPGLEIITCNPPINTMNYPDLGVFHANQISMCLDPHLN